jgi:hypothetical protein
MNTLKIGFFGKYQNKYFVILKNVESISFVFQDSHIKNYIHSVYIYLYMYIYIFIYFELYSAMHTYKAF